MATKPDDLELDPTETPVIFGLWQLIPSDEPTLPPTQNPIIKYMSRLLNTISLPVAYLFYFGNKIPLAYSPNQKWYLILLTLILPSALFCLNYFYIADKIKKVPVMPTVSMPRKPAGCRPKKPNTSGEENPGNSKEQKKWDDYNKNTAIWESYDYKLKTWNKYNEKVQARMDSIQSRSISYMICIWMVMITSLILFFPRLQHTAE